MSMKYFTKKFPKVKKKDAQDFLAENLWNMLDDYTKRGHLDKDQVSELFNSILNIKSATYMNKFLCKKENRIFKAVPFLYTLIEVVSPNVNDIEDGGEILSLYMGAIDRILKKRLKKFHKAVKINNDIAEALLTVLPHPEELPDVKRLAFPVNSINRKLYLLIGSGKEIVEDDREDLWKSPSYYKDVYSFLFGEDMMKHITVQILLEYKENITNMNEDQKSVWNALTNMALGYLNDLSKQDIREALEEYASKRRYDIKKGRDKSRRTSLMYIDSEEYPKLSKQITKMIEEDKYKDLFI